MMKVLAFSLLSLLLLTTRSTGQELRLAEENSEDLTRLLNDMTVIAELGTDPKEKSAYRVRLFRVPSPGECDGTPESCPTEYVYVAVSEWGEIPDQKLYRLPEAYGWEFESIDDMPKRPSETTFVTFRVKRKVIARDLTKGWWDEEGYEIHANAHSASMQKMQ